MSPSALRRAVIVVVAALALATSACSAAPGAGSAPLAFTAPTLAGARFDVASLAGTPVAMWFWAPWCAICRAEAPDVAAAAAQYQGKVRILGVPGLGEVAAMKEFVAETGTGNLTHLVDADGTLWKRFGVVAQPAFVFVDRSGTARTVAGALDPASLRQALDGLSDAVRQ